MLSSITFDIVVDKP